MCGCLVSPCACVSPSWCLWCPAASFLSRVQRSTTDLCRTSEPLCHHPWEGRQEVKEGQQAEPERRTMLRMGWTFTERWYSKGNWLVSILEALLVQHVTRQDFKNNLSLHILYVVEYVHMHMGLSTCMSWDCWAVEAHHRSDRSPAQGRARSVAWRVADPGSDWSGRPYGW